MNDRLGLTSVLERFRQPEYTGANRCLPCTVVNVALAIAIATGLALASPLVGVLTFGAFLVTIWLRGYLVPGTPTLTRQYFPKWLLSPFGKAPADRPTVAIESVDLEDALVALKAVAVVAPRDGTDGVRLTSAFRERWNGRLEAFRTAETDGEDTWQPPDADAVAATFGVDIEQRGETTFELEGAKRLRWESDAALAADIAADRELRVRLEGWDEFEADDRRDVLIALRLLRKRCPVPDCEGRLSRDRERLEHCCRRPQIGLESTCETCSRSIVTLAVPEESPLLEWLPESESASDSESEPQNATSA